MPARTTERLLPEVLRRLAVAFRPAPRCLQLLRREQEAALDLLRPAGRRRKVLDRRLLASRARGLLLGHGCPPPVVRSIQGIPERKVRSSRSANPYGVTVSDVALVAVPSVVVIEILPDSAPTGTVKPTCVTVLT